MRWIFLRGLAREARHWGRFPQTFERIVPDATVECLDLPGSGTERERASPTRIGDIVADLRARWVKLRAPSDEGGWAILGMSLGGMVAMDWCARHPKDFARAVLAGSSASDLSPPWRRFDLAVVPTALAAMRDPDPRRREAKILSMNARMHPALGDIAAEWSRFPPMARRNVARQLRAAMRFRAPAQLEPPVLVLAGARDPLAHPSCSKLLAERFGARLRIHPAAGHELALDAPEWFANEVAAWLASLQPEIKRAR